MTESSITERIGVHKVALTFLEKYGWIEREQFVADFGIDTQIEIVEDNIPTGLLYCIQVKAGESYLKGNDNNIVFYFDEKHKSYWLNHSLPVILIVCDLNTNDKYWQFVNTETVNKTKEAWKIEIPKKNLLDEEISKQKIRQFYFNNDNFTIIESGIDTSHALSRRISMKIILKNDVSDIIIKNQLPSLIEGLKKSDYYRSEIVESMYKGKKADCVWIWFYRNFEQYKNGLPFCTAYWNAPESKSPTILRDDDEKLNDIRINWAGEVISSSFLSQRLSKGKYLKIVDNYIKELEIIFLKIKTEFEEIRVIKDFQKFLVHTLSLRKSYSKLLPDEFHQNFAPLECSDLNQIILGMDASIDNIFIILDDKKRSSDNMIQCVKMYLKTCSEKIGPLKYERGKVK
jgi:hypothetical protein